VELRLLNETTPIGNLFVASPICSPHTGIGNRDKKYVGRLDIVLLINVILPPFDR
jgi:hypothetical protein